MTPFEIVLLVFIIIFVVAFVAFLFKEEIGKHMYTGVSSKKAKELEEFLEKKQVNIYKVEIGMRMDEVEALMGKTEFKRMYKRKDGTTHEWKYHLNDYTDAYIEFDKLNLVSKVSVI